MGNSQRSKIFRVLGYLKPYIGLQLLLIVLAALVAGLQFAYPWSLKWLIDEVMTQKQAHMLVPTILVLFLVGILIALVQMLQSVFTTSLRERIVHDIRAQLAQQMRCFSLGYFHRERTGDIMSLYTNDAAAMGEFYGSTATLCYERRYKVCTGW